MNTKEAIERRENIERMSVFVRGHCNAIRDELLREISQDRIPYHFNGHHLRVILAERFKESAAMSFIVQSPRLRVSRNFRNWQRTAQY